MQQASSSTYPASCPEADPFEIENDSNAAGIDFDFPREPLCGSSLKIEGDSNAAGFVFDLSRKLP